jgi:predicted phosphodiesterase
MSDNPMDLLGAAEDGNVRAFVSGHIHDVDDIEVAGARFICSGSVSGQQWRGPKLPRPGCEEGFGIFDCRPDGSFDYAYHDYGWQAKP